MYTIKVCEYCQQDLISTSLTQPVFICFPCLTEYYNDDPFLHTVIDSKLYCVNLLGEKELWKYYEPIEGNLTLEFFMKAATSHMKPLWTSIMVLPSSVSFNFSPQNINSKIKTLLAFK